VKEGDNKLPWGSHRALPGCREGKLGEEREERTKSEGKTRPSERKSPWGKPKDERRQLEQSLVERTGDNDGTKVRVLPVERRRTVGGERKVKLYWPLLETWRIRRKSLAYCDCYSNEATLN